MAPIIFEPDSCTAVRYLESSESEKGCLMATYNRNKAAFSYEADMYRPDDDQVCPALHILWPTGLNNFGEEKDELLAASGAHASLPTGLGEWQPTIRGLVSICSHLHGNWQSRRMTCIAYVHDSLQQGQGWIASCDLQMELEGEIGALNTYMPTMILPSPLRCLGADPEGADPKGDSLNLTCTLHGHETTVSFHPALFWTPEHCESSQVSNESGTASREL